MKSLTYKFLLVDFVFDLISNIQSTYLIVFSSLLEQDSMIRNNW